MIRLPSFARFLLRIFFREVEVAGLERFPARGPRLVVANHVNGLIDPVLLFGLLPAPPRFLAKSTLWKIPILRSLLDLAGAIPVYRRQDSGADVRKNEETFARCHEVLAAGGTVSLFPEGTSHSEPSLQPLKTGAARIALEAEARFGPLGLQIVPVGLLFDDKGKFRSRALLQVGEPFAAEGEVRALTARIDDALQDVTLNYDSWEEARLVERAADLYARPELDVPRGRTLQETVDLRRALLDGYRELRERFPERIAALADEMRSYDRLLQLFGLRDEQVAARYLPSPVLRFIGRTALRLGFHLPLAVVGTALNLLPYWIVKGIAHRVRKTPDQHATMKVFPSLVLYPAFWVLQGIALGFLTSWPWGLLAAFAALPTGWAAMRFLERQLYFGREARGFLLLRTRTRLAEELRERRRRLYREVAELADSYRQSL